MCGQKSVLQSNILVVWLTCEKGVSSSRVLKMWITDLNAYIRKPGLNHLIDVFGNYIANVLFHFHTEPHPPTNLSAEIQCRQGYEIRIHWQVNT